MPDLIYKALTHTVGNNTVFVDDLLIFKGIYETSKPALFENSMTMIDLKEKYIAHLGVKENSQPKVLAAILKNLERCKLSEVKLVIVGE